MKTVYKQGCIGLLLCLCVLGSVGGLFGGVGAQRVYAQSLDSRVVRQAAIGGCPLFPADNVWNQDISALPVHANSANYIASIGIGNRMHPDFGSGLYDGKPIGIPYMVVPANQAVVPVQFGYAGESDAGPYPVPVNAPIEGGAQSSGDRHVIVVQSGTCKLYEMFSSYPKGSGWKAGSGAVWNLTSNALRPAGWTSADAAGLPILPGLARYDEVAAGVITHALRFTAPRTQKAFVWPARHFASSNGDLNLPPMGLRVRLKANVDISGFPPQARIVLTALKQYGMILADNGSSWFVGGAPDDRWVNDDLASLHGITGESFEVVDTSGMQIQADSAQAQGVVMQPTPTVQPTATPKPKPTPTATPKATATATQIIIPGRKNGRESTTASSEEQREGMAWWMPVGGVVIGGAVLGGIGMVVWKRRRKKS